MTFGSLFSGIGGMDLGLERAGMECRWQVEIDPFCQKVLTKHWPKVPKYEDITKLDGRELERVDLIAGGFPCQDISYAGAGPGAGLDGNRSGLWREMLRIVRVVRPRFVLVENVPALLTRGMGRVLGELAESGYDAEWQCLSAAAFGAPHIRERVFIVANSNCLRELQPQGSFENEWRWSSDGSSKEMANSYSSRFQNLQGCEKFSPHDRSAAIGCSSWWDIEPAVGRVADGVPQRVDRLKGLGNAVVPQVAEWIGRRILDVS